MMEHILKCWPVYFDAIQRGDKNFEVRRDDRGFQRGDILVLQRTSERESHRVQTDYYGHVEHEIRREISYILTGGQLGIEPGYVVMALATQPEGKS
jgi:ASC-1-like (ASCH) protein